MTTLNLGFIIDTLKNDGFNCEVVEVTKNGVNLTGIRYHKEGCNVAPTFYIDHCKTDIEAITACKKVFSEPIPDFSDPFESFDPSKLTARVYAKGKVDTDIKRDFLDMEIVATWSVNKGDINGSITMRSDYLKLIGMTAEEVLNKAIENTCKATYAKSLVEYLGIPYGLVPDIMYMLTSSFCSYGAAAILNTEALKEVADKLHSDLFVLPSSVHEVITVPAESDDVETLLQMVRCVNATELEPTEKLTDNVYRFNRSTQELVIA